MEKTKNIIILIDVYSNNGGASKVAMTYARKLREYGYNTFFVCNNVLHGEKCPNEVVVMNSVQNLVQFFRKNVIVAIHYFKAKQLLKERSIFGKVIEALYHVDVTPKILITVCQQPSYSRAILTPYEIKHSDMLIFIDKTAYNDPIYNFIPKDRKCWMYLLASKEMLQNAEEDKFVKKNYVSDESTIVFGRGSTLNKCPKDVITLYDKIRSSQDKRFVIVGVPEEQNWLTNIIAKREGHDIITYPLLPIKEYAEIVGSFDIMLYYIPKSSYSSIDGSLRMAFRLGVPVVLYGSPAIQESVIHGSTAFIAKNKEEFVYYAELLANDASLREKIGRNARKHYFDDAPDEYWVVKHKNIMEKVLKEVNNNSIHIPLIVSVKIYFIKNVSWALEALSKVIIKFCR